MAKTSPIPSRYAGLPHLVYQPPAGATIVYLARRLVPEASQLPKLRSVEVKPGQVDRLDLVAAQTLGPPQLFWRLADANNAVNPFNLVTQSGRKLAVPKSS